MSSASAVFDYGVNCPSMSWWLKLEEADGGAGSTLLDSCDGNDFTRVGTTEKTLAVWDFGQFSGYIDDDWFIMSNLSALTTGSRSWRAIMNLTTTYGSGVYSDNETLFGQDWANFMLFETEGSLVCYCRQADTGLRLVGAAFSTNAFYDVLCSYDASDSNRLTIYMNGTWIASNTGDACDYESQQGEMVIDSYPLVGFLPRDTGVFDEVFYRKEATNPLEAYCLWAYNNLDCSSPEPEPSVSNCSNVSLYTTKGFLVGGFSDNNSCSVTITRNDTGNVVEARTIMNDCLNSGASRFSSDCYIYPFNGEVSYSIFLDKRYSTGVYDVAVRCGGVTNASYCFNVQTPGLTAVDFNQYPQFLTTMKLMARTDTESTRECTARIISESGSTTAVVPGVKSAEQGFFSFEHFLLWEAPYSNYTLNVTCNDLSTFQTTFKPVFVDEGVLGGVSFGLGFQAVLVVIAVLFAIIILVCAHLFWNAITGGVSGVK